MTRSGELAGELGAYTPELVRRALEQTARQAPRLAYAMVPDEALAIVDADDVRNTLDGAAHSAGEERPCRCLVPWRVERLQMTLYCLLDAGHDDPELADEAHNAGFSVELVDEHGWYPFLDAGERGQAAMDAAAERILARAAAARRVIDTAVP